MRERGGGGRGRVRARESSSRKVYHCSQGNSADMLLRAILRRRTYNAEDMVPGSCSNN